MAQTTARKTDNGTLIGVVIAAVVGVGYLLYWVFGSR
jgi:hypothetical protein